MGEGSLILLAPANRLWLLGAVYLRLYKHFSVDAVVSLRIEWQIYGAVYRITALKASASSWILLDLEFELNLR